MSACKSCSAPIRWELTSAGHHIPLDSEPVVGGNIAMVNGRATFVTPSPVSKAYISHFVTCPNADEWRKR